MALLDNATNMFGPLPPDVKRQIMAYIDNPTVEQWDEIFCYIINGNIRSGTLWAAVTSIDPTFPRSVPSPSGRKKRVPANIWPRIPDPLTVARAIRKATTPHQNTAVGG